MTTTTLSIVKNNIILENNTEIKTITPSHMALKYFEKERFGFESRTLKVLPEIDFSKEEIIIPVVTKNNKQIKISISVNETV